jgi:probable rRNA maturation factor
VDPDSKRLRVSVTDGRGRPVRDGGLARWLAGVVPARVRGEVAIALVSDARIRALNQAYRRTNLPTDVLSFPAASAGNGTAPSDGVDGLLGDIVIATGVARRQAKAAGHSEQTEFRVLAVHGLLHLLGYDHHDARAAARMAAAERRLLRKGRLVPAGASAKAGRVGLVERAERQVRG